MEWTEWQHGCSHLYLGRDLVIGISWSNEGHKVTFAGYTLKDRPQSREEAQAKGIAFAKNILKLSLNKLETL